MPDYSRRSLFGAAAALPTAGGNGPTARQPGKLHQRDVSLDGEWEFRPEGGQWRIVHVPHTWQVEEELAGYMGKAWYRRRIGVPVEWKGGGVSVEFEGVFHSARVQVNGRGAGEHIGKGYTAFNVDVTDLVNYGGENVVTVEADNSFSSTMLPRNGSYDWTPDGGIYRPVWLRVSPALSILRVEIDAVPDLDAGTAQLEMRAIVKNRGRRTARVSLEVEVLEESSGRLAARCSTAAEVAGGSLGIVRLPRVRIEQAMLWHFDHPHLYSARFSTGEHEHEESFGIRSFAARDGGFYLNGEKVRLAGVERMAGSNPGFGMAEPAAWIEHDHRDMQELNCVFTRVHWMQDRRVLDWCDRHGMLMQLEVPTWGPATWKGMGEAPDPAILANGLDQLREMIAQNRNHPSVFAWGLCNEIGGHLPAAKKFAQALFREARRLDPHRLLSYASNTLHSHTVEDVAGEMDFLEWNEYYESWYGGRPDDLRQSLKKIREAYPNKAIVISEYGLCECSPKNPAGDERRIEILKAHNAVFREEPHVAGLIFFCYNDYRTHMGDKGTGALRQRVHGVVDLLGRRKPSYEALRRESSPVEEVRLERSGKQWLSTIATRAQAPCYRLTGYRVRLTAYGFGGLPMERKEAELPALDPGSRFEAQATLQSGQPARVVVELVRPGGSTVASAEWLG